MWPIRLDNPLRSRPGARQPASSVGFGEADGVGEVSGELNSYSDPIALILP